MNKRKQNKKNCIIDKHIRDMNVNDNQKREEANRRYDLMIIISDSHGQGCTHSFESQNCINSLL